MALHTKWSSGDQIWYDGTQDILTIKNSTDGILIGADEAGVDAKFFGGTASAYMLWDADVDDLVFSGGAGIALDGGNFALEDGDYLYFGDAPDVSMRWTTGGVFEILPAADSDMYLGSSGFPLDVVNYGNITYRAPRTKLSTGALTLAITDNRFQFIDSSGADNILLPSATGGTAKGIQFFIARGSTSTGTVSVYDGSATGSLVAEIARYESGILVNDGVQWKGIVNTAT